MHKSYLNTPIGLICLEAEKEGVTKIFFSDGEIELVTSESNPILDWAKSELGQYFEGKLKDFSFPIILHGTVFQQQVWKLLQEVPFGKTKSYLEMSKLYGNTKAIRALGTANGKNPIAIVLPCHRVIGSNGDLVGYSGGLWRKQWLLNHEAETSGQQRLF